jgi:CheY-like chemotaxis protein
MFDLVILDLNMPISDGYEACKKIHSIYNDEAKVLFTNKIVNKINLNFLKEFKPIILACTSEVIDTEKNNYLIQNGFDLVA